MVGTGRGSRRAGAAGFLVHARVFVLEWSIPIRSSARLASSTRLAKKTVKMQFFLMTLIPLQAFLQNCRNFSHANRSESKIGKIGVLLQEFHQMAVKIAKIPACTQDFAFSSNFLRVTLLLSRFPHPPLSRLALAAYN